MYGSDEMAKSGVRISVDHRFLHTEYMTCSFGNYEREYLVHFDKIRANALQPSEESPWRARHAVYSIHTVPYCIKPQYHLLLMGG